MKTAHCARREEEALLSSLWQCAVMTGRFSLGLPFQRDKCPSAGAATSAPRNWPGKGPAGRCLDDLYTSPVRPPPPASSARPLYQ